MAAPAYKKMVVDSTVDDLIVSSGITGTAASWLKPSLRALGIDPDNMPAAPERQYDSSKPVAATPKRQPRSYAGLRRKLLVVDNEEADRELLVNLLQPLGFEIRTAASGHDCLDLMAAGLQPDAILMDLAMPGIDGWETIRRLRALGGQSQPHIAIVSANAFDKGLDNDAGIRAEDFILKPVRHSELLDWLERQLQLRWLAQPAAPLPAPAAPAGALVWPAAVELQALRDMVSLLCHNIFIHTFNLCF
jgi:CheY-like chemotaxis protein